MKSSLKVAMRASIFEVLETMFFLPVEIHECSRLNDAICVINEDVSKCRLNFSGKHSGAFILYIPNTLLRELIKNFLGMDKDNIQSDQMNGMIREITNMIAGNTLSRWNNHCVYNLQIPEIVRTNNNVLGSEDILYGICSANGHMAVQVTIDRPYCHS